MLTSVTTTDDNTQEKDARKPYEKPQVIYRAPLEAMAANCLPGGKLVQGVGGCSTAQS